MSPELCKTPLRYQHKNVDYSELSEKLANELSNLKMFMNKLYYDLKNVDYKLMVKFQHTLNLKDYTKSSLQKLIFPKQNAYKLADLIQIHKKANNCTTESPKKSPRTFLEEKSIQTSLTPELCDSNRSNKNLELISFQNIKEKEKELENLMIKSKEFQNNITNIEAKLNGILDGNEHESDNEQDKLTKFIKKQKTLEDQINDLKNENIALKSLECFDLNKIKENEKNDKDHNCEISNLLQKQQEETIKNQQNMRIFEREIDHLKEEKSGLLQDIERMKEKEKAFKNKISELERKDELPNKKPEKLGKASIRPEQRNHVSFSQNEDPNEEERKNDKKKNEDFVIKSYLKSLNETVVKEVENEAGENISPLASNIENKEKGKFEAQNNFGFEGIIKKYLQSLNDHVLFEIKKKLEEKAQEETIAKEKDLFMIKEYLKSLNERVLREFKKKFQKLPKKSLNEIIVPKSEVIQPESNLLNISKEKEKEDLNEILLRKEDELNVLKKVYNDLQSENDELRNDEELFKKKLTFHEKQIIELENEKDALLKDLMHYKSELDKNHNGNGKNDENEKKADEELFEQMKMLEADKKLLHDENEFLVSNGTSLAEELKTCKRKIESLKESEELKNEFIELRTHIYDLEQANENIIIKVDKYIQAYETLLKKFKELHKNYRKLLLDKK